MRNFVAPLILFLSSSLSPWHTSAFPALASRSPGPLLYSKRRLTDGDDDKSLPSRRTENDEVFALSQHQIPKDTLTPPPINVRRESILFGENPTTQRKNNARWVWSKAKEQLPFLLTGARSTSTADDNPWGGLYNMILVRLPVILCGIVYSKNLLEGHPLVLDLGKGPWEASPILVYGILYVILR